jgi:hypothetical protein
MVQSSGFRQIAQSTMARLYGSVAHVGHTNVPAGTFVRTDLQIKVFPQEIHDDRTSGTEEQSAPGGMIDSYEAAELLQVFLMGRGYGVSAKAPLDAPGRVEIRHLS